MMIGHIVDVRRAIESSRPERSRRTMPLSKSCLVLSVPAPVASNLAMVVLPLALLGACRPADRGEVDPADSNGLLPSGDNDDDDNDDGSDEDDGGTHLDSGENNNDDGQSHSYIWIANSSQGTVSKIDTMTVEEVGRYYTRPDGAGDPSRTSVSVTANVAVANRLGGVTKIYSRKSDCEDKNSNGEIDTSTGGNDILPWEDECIAWHVPMNYGSQRALAWTAGDTLPDSEEVINEKLWVSGENEGEEKIDIMLLDGDTGEIEDEVSIKLLSDGPLGFPYRAYGGAVDREGNFWFTTLGGPSVVVRVALDDMKVDQWPKEQWSYGMTVDGRGRVFTCEVEVGRFDPETETWTRKSAWDLSVDVGWDFNAMGELQVDMGGCMVDGEKRLWVPARNEAGTWDGVLGLNADTLKGIKVIKLPKHPHGISIDFEGFVWGVSGTAGGTSEGNSAYKIDPEAGSYVSFDDLDGAYTYSDMTGWALASTQDPIE